MKKITTILFSVLALFIFLGSAAAQTTIYSDDFTGEDSKGQIGTTNDISGVDWSIDVSSGSFSDNDDYFSVQSGIFEGQDVDGDVIWTSEIINISGFNSLEFSFDAAACCDFEASSDIFEVEFIIDSGSSESLFSAIVDEEITDDPMFFGSTQLTNTLQNFAKNISGTGSNAQIQIIVNNNAGSELYKFDNLIITGTSTGGTPTQLAITEINGGNSPSVGTPFDVIVQAQDGSGTASNVSSDVDVNIRFGTGSGSLGGTLSGTISSGNNQTTVSGVTYDTAESGISIEVADNASNLSTGTSSSFEVLEAAFQLVFVDLPDDGIVHSPLSTFTVEARRPDDSVDLNFSESISLSKASGPGSVGGTTTQNTTNGVATFDDITIDDDGGHTLQATGGTLASSASGEISIIEVNIVLNEFLADPPTGADPNGDGSPDTGEDEFIEFVNTGDSDLDITGWTIEEEGGLAHTFTSTVLSPNQPVVVFSGGSADGYFGGAIAQISTEGFTLNNGSDSIILKNDSGVEIINYSYGSEGGNDESITRSPDLTGNFTGHSSADPGGSNFSPGLRLDGFSFLPSVQITGSEGWRMFSSPTADNSFDDLLEPIWTQGSATGADDSAGEPNVVTYSGSSFTAVDDLTSDMTAGQGFLVFVYSDDDYTDSGSDNGFPKILEMPGTENSGSVSPSINEGASNTATLVGNPYLSPIDWDELTKSNLTNTVYVYDHSYGSSSSPDEEAAEVAGSYRVWNGSSGSLDEGRIAPFQGFWVIYDGSGSASLTIEESDKTTGGMFYKEQSDHQISIRLKAEADRMFNETFFSFNEDGKVGMDNFDGLELTPLDHGDYLSLATESDNTLLDINNLPLEFSEMIEIPLHINTFQAINGGWSEMRSEVTLTWPELKNIPSEWSLTLIDKQNGGKVNLKEAGSYAFFLEGSSLKTTDKAPFHPFSNNPVQQEKVPQNNRFILSIDPNSEKSIADNNIPNQFALLQNYPNPFNPTTNIKYEIADLTEVELSVYNVMGQRIATLVNEAKSPGSYEVTWDASEVASGIYYYQLNVSGVVFTRQMTLIK